MEPLLSLRKLTTVFDTDAGTVRAVDDVDLDIYPGETVGLVGESGSGKTVTALSILRLVQPPGRIAGGAILFRGRDLMAASEREMQSVRGAGIALVFQEPMTALDPVMRVGDQIVEAIRVHRRKSRRAARAEAVELLRLVSIPDPESGARDYPHQMSGGMRQRVLIAMALANRPALLIADEPTTALDVTIQAQILDLLRDMKARFDLAMLLITHDLGVVAETCDRVAIMYAGRIVEEAPVRDIFYAPRHPYTKGLLESMPKAGAGHPPVRGARLISIEGTVPDLLALPPGCAFGPRCPEHMARCDVDPPASFDIGPTHHVRCYLYEEGSHRPAAVGSRPPVRPRPSGEHEGRTP